ncbi:MAG: hypothetical protein LBC28_03845, partial [Oscillospiraceae bacterium]|jgi:hypothetical protein|nr:hypothetical protein [Oscillospiraceae bacterium]
MPDVEKIVRESLGGAREVVQGAMRNMRGAMGNMRGVMQNAPKQQYRTERDETAYRGGVDLESLNALLTRVDHLIDVAGDIGDEEVRAGLLKDAMQFLRDIHSDIKQSAD